MAPSPKKQIEGNFQPIVLILPILRNDAFLDFFFKLENKNLRLSQYLRIRVFKPRCIYGGGAGMGGYEPHIVAKEITSINGKLCERLNQGNKNKHLLSICHLNHSLGDLSTQALYLTLD